MSYPRPLAVACLLLGACGGQPYELLLADARQVSGCGSVRHVSTEADVYIVEGCGKTLRLRCQSEWNEPWCCREESAPRRTDCAAEPVPEAPGTDKTMPGFNAPQ